MIPLHSMSTELWARALFRMVISFVKEVVTRLAWRILRSKAVWEQIHPWCTNSLFTFSNYCRRYSAVVGKREGRR